MPPALFHYLNQQVSEQVAQQCNNVDLDVNLMLFWHEKKRKKK
jgi:hypothetical protein